jgi:hypothetical protein
MKNMATVFLAYKANSYNKAIIDFLLKNVKAIKETITLKVILVKNPGKLNKAIKSLPTMEWVEDGSPKYIVGVAGIVSALGTKPKKKPETDGMETYWNSIMMSGDNDPDPSEEFGRKLPSLAEAMTQQRNSQTPQKKAGNMQERSHEEGDGHLPHQPLGDSKPGSVASFEDDPLMKRFFENQETSPGEGEYEQIDYGTE